MNNYSALIAAAALASPIAIAHADSSGAAPQITLEVLQVDDNGVTQNGWKATLSNAGTSEWTWGTTGWTDLTQSGPTSWFTLDANGDWTMNQDWNWAKQGWFNLDLDDQGTGGNLDPYINYAMAVKNTSAGSLIFNQSVIAPVSPTLSGANLVKASVSGGLTDATGNGVRINPAPRSGIPQDGDGTDELQLFLLSSDGLTWSNAGVDVGLPETEAGAPNSYTYGVYHDGYLTPVGGPIGAWNWMQLRTRFSLTGNDDTAAINGYAFITADTPGPQPVPEADSYAFLAIGMGLVGLLARRRSA